MVKNLLATAGDTRDPGSILGLERSPGVGNGNPLSSILAWKILWTEEPGGLQSMGSQSRTRLSTHTHTHILFKAKDEEPGLSWQTRSISHPQGAHSLEWGTNMLLPNRWQKEKLWMVLKQTL